MIESFNLLRNVGTFDSADSGAQLPLNRVALIYAENGRGKTTLAAILRSLASGDPLPVIEGHRLGAQHPPHIVITGSSGQAIFQNGAWSTTLPDIVVFDDEFVAQNVCSGMKIEAGHRQKLHELIIGAHGVALNATVQQHVERVEQHNRELQARARQIPANVRGGLTVDEFCALRNRDDLDVAIQQAERMLAAGKQADAIRQRGHFVPFFLPRFDTQTLEALLARDLPDLQAAAAARVQAHIAKLGRGGEAWISSGMMRIAGASDALVGHFFPYLPDVLGSYNPVEVAADSASDQMGGDGTCP